MSMNRVHSRRVVYVELARKLLGVLLKWELELDAHNMYAHLSL
jgi:hypothetical protein